MVRRATLPSVLAALAACHQPRVLSEGDVAAISAECRARVDDGRSPTAFSQNVGARPERSPAGTPVVIYGAAWCTACSIARSYLTRKNIPFVEHDVEDEPDAQAAMRVALSQAGLEGRRSLPVIDVRGTVTSGFYPCVVEQAWRAP